MTLGRSALGKGLSALIPAPRFANQRDDFFLCKIDDVQADPNQPRQRFDDEKLDELVASIKEKGILQPIVVRRASDGKPGYIVVAGERRLRAARKAGLSELPVLVKDVASSEALELALIENLQREDLNPIETARAFSRLVEEQKQSIEKIAQRVGKDRSTISNSLRLLKLPKEVLDLVENGELSEGHGRAILTAESPSRMIELAKQAVAQGWSVRETERRARGEAKPAAAPKQKSANVRDLESRLAKRLGSPVAIEDNEGKGKIEIRYASLDELDRLLNQLMR